MTMPMTGADIAHLESLAESYGAAGAEIADRAQQLRARITTAVTALSGSVDTLETDTGALTRQMGDDLGLLKGHAADVPWTGANRLAFDADLDTFSNSVQAGLQAMVDGVRTLRTAGVDPFNAVLTDFAGAVSDAGDGVEVNAATMRGGVARQHDALQQAGEIGWSAA